MTASDPSSIHADLASMGLLAGTLGLTSSVYHIGFVVPDIDAAVASMGAALNITFCPPAVVPITEVETPNGKVPVRLKVAYSTRPCHVELIEADPGSMYAADSDWKGIHLGVWAENVEAEMARLAGMGMPAEWWGRSANGGIPFSFHRTPFGLYIELVSTVARQFMQRQFIAADPALAVG